MARARSWITASQSSGYNVSRPTGRHQGVDIPLSKGTPVAPLSGGIAIVPKPDKLNGNYVIIQHPSGHKTSYSHLNAVNVKDGQAVTKDDIIGSSGNTGRVRGAGGGYHLHFGARDPSGKRINPQMLLSNPSLLGQEKAKSAPEQSGVQTPPVQNMGQSSASTASDFDIEGATEENFASLLAKIGTGSKKKRKPKNKFPGILDGLL
jgi:hypothetical protein